jgi:hypothetical protein
LISIRSQSTCILAPEMAVESNAENMRKEIFGLIDFIDTLRIVLLFKGGCLSIPCVILFSQYQYELYSVTVKYTVHFVNCRISINIADQGRFTKDAPESEE